MEIGIELSELIEESTLSDETTRRVLDIFDRLLELAREHFRREERIMVERKLSIFPRHHEEHQNLLKTMQDYRGHIASGRVGLSSELKIRILEWWLDHTNGTDALTFCGECQTRKRQSAIDNDRTCSAVT